MGCHFLLQGVFLTQGLNLGLLHCRQMLYCLSHQGSHFIDEKIKVQRMKSLAHSCSSWWQSGLEVSYSTLLARRKCPASYIIWIFVSLLLLLSQIQTILPFPPHFVFSFYLLCDSENSPWCDFYLVSPSSQKSRAINPPPRSPSFKPSASQTALRSCLHTSSSQTQSLLFLTAILQ